MKQYFHIGYFRSGGEQIVRERSRHWLPGLVETHSLEQGVADAVDNAAVNLALGDHRIDQSSTVMNADVSQDADVTGPDIHLHFARVRGIGKRLGVKLEQ